MTVRTPAYLKTVFENADIPQASDYEDIFDSFLPLTSTAKQTLNFPAEFTGDVTASGDIWCKDLYVNKVNAQRVSASAISFNTLDVSQVSASVGNFNIVNAQYVSASVARIGYIVEPVVASIAATGTVTASAARVSAALNVINAVTSGSQECLILKRARPGFTQMIINGTSTSAKVFPVSASKFNGQSNGAPIDIPQNRTLQVFHITSAQFYTATHTR